MAASIMPILNPKQRQHKGKQNSPKCGAVSGFRLQNGSFPNSNNYFFPIALHKNMINKINTIATKMPIILISPFTASETHICVTLTDIG